MVDNKKIENWVTEALKTDPLTDYDIQVEGQSSKGDGYLGDITFLSVSGRTKNGEKKIKNLVIKSSKQSQHFRSKFSIKDAFDKEIFIYETVARMFEKFKNERGVKEDFLNFMPLCHGTLSSESEEILILKNLKIDGYDNWNRKIPMSSEHVKIVLQAYGRWHGISLALKTQNREIFEKLTENNVNMFSKLITCLNFEESFFNIFKEVREKMFENGHLTALEKLNFDLTDFKHFITDLYFEEPEYHVITHGDCWNGNFMFKSQPENLSEPLRLKIIDWQCSGLASPAFDLSHFLYCCCPVEDLEDQEKLLRIYHESLCETLRRLGSDPEVIFPYCRLLEHWQKFSKFGLMICSLVFKMCMAESEAIPDFVELAEKGDDFKQWADFKLRNEEEFFDRAEKTFLAFAKNAGK